MDDVVYSCVVVVCRLLEGPKLEDVTEWVRGVP